MSYSSKAFVATAALTGLMGLPALAAPLAPTPRPPNVLLVIFDDLNDWNKTLDRAAPIQMPNLDRLAAQGVLFSHAYCASPACNPSRTALLTGLSPATTGVYANHANWKRITPYPVTLPRYFRDHGYYSAGAGKVFHHELNYAFQDDTAFDEFQKNLWPFDAPMPPEKLNGLKAYGTRNSDWGVWPAKEKNSVDHRTVDFGINFLQRRRDKPFFLAIGIFRPHSPQFAPKEFAERYPADRVTMPVVNAQDRDDLPPAALRMLQPNNWRLQGLLDADRGGTRYWSDFVRFYQAAATYADSQFGRLLDALQASSYRDNTIVVALSDNGYHLGEKGHIEKFALWEKTSHIPLIIVAPGVTPPGRVCVRPVSLLDLYPTLLELAQLPPKPECEGISLRPLLQTPDRPWDRPAVMTYLRGNHAVRTERWRYIQYADHGEELYDDVADPHEWTNLARDPQFKSVLAELRRYLPKTNAPDVPDMSAGSAAAWRAGVDPTESDPAVAEAVADRN
jgi:arylsulfatase A-like enzyme